MTHEMGAEEVQQLQVLPVFVFCYSVRSLRC